MPAAPIVFGREFFEVDPRSTALIIIDMQNAFVAEGATYETPGARTMMPNLERLIGFAREQGMPIVWTQSDHSAPFGGVMLKKFPTIREDKYLWKGQPSFELYEHMPPPKETEYRVVKHKYDAFFETDLELDPAQSSDQNDHHRRHRDQCLLRVDGPVGIFPRLSGRFSQRLQRDLRSGNARSVAQDHRHVLRPGHDHG